MAAPLRRRAYLPLILLLIAVSKFQKMSSASIKVIDWNENVRETSCDENVRDAFRNLSWKLAGALHSSPNHEAKQSVCSSKKYAHNDSCCSQEIEHTFSYLTERKLMDDLRRHNSKLKNLISHTYDNYIHRLDKLSLEAKNHTTAFLARHYHIPALETESPVMDLFRRLQNEVTSIQSGFRIEEIVYDFFHALFPLVFNYVLSGRDQDATANRLNAEYGSCLKAYTNHIEPFGNLPDLLVTQLTTSIKHASVFVSSLKTFLHTLTSVESIQVGLSCRQALVAMQLCPVCRGFKIRTLSSPLSRLKPCRGYCHNVIMGCFSKLLEISGDWDDVVVAFQNLEVAMLGKYEYNEILFHMDQNISEAILIALEDSARIYVEAGIKCQRQTHDYPLHHVITSWQLLNVSLNAFDKRTSDLLIVHRKEVRTLVKVLDNSKGIFNRIADTVCSVDMDYVQDMQSHLCWNGSAIGRYTDDVIEANFMNHVMRNKEVNVSFSEVNYELLAVKNHLQRTRLNLSRLMKADIMQSDRPSIPASKMDVMPVVEGSGWVYDVSHRDVVIDDDDFDNYGSGSGSGSGDEEDFDSEIDGEQYSPETTNSSDAVRSLLSMPVTLLFISVPHFAACF